MRPMQTGTFGLPLCLTMPATMATAQPSSLRGNGASLTLTGASGQTLGRYGTLSGLTTRGGTLSATAAGAIITDGSYARSTLPVRRHGGRNGPQG
jgi:hypothetical protein